MLAGLWVINFCPFQRSAKSRTTLYAVGLAPEPLFLYFRVKLPKVFPVSPSFQVK